MGDRIKGITIEVDGDTTGLTTAMKKTNNEIKSTSSALADVNRLLKLDPTNTELLQQKQRLLKQAVEETRNKLDTLKEAEKQVQQQFAEGKISQEQYDALKREIIATEASLNSLEEQAQSSNAALSKISISASEFGNKATDIGKKATVVSGAIVAIGSAGVAATMALDSGYDTIIKKTGATGQALDALNVVADNIFADMPTTMDNVGIAVGEVNTRFKVTGEELEDLSKEFIKFAEINDTDLNNSIGITNKIMQQWNIETKETSKVLGLMTFKAQETGISIDTLMNSVQHNGATFKEMGLNMTQSVNLLAQFEANGVNADIAIAGLRKSIQNYTKEGISTETALANTINAIKNAKNETEALSKAQEVFGNKGAAEMARAISEGRINIEALSVSLSEYGNVVSNTFEETLDPWDETEVAMNNVKLAGSELGKTILTTLQPSMTKMCSFIKEITKRWTNMSDSTKKVVLVIAMLVAVIGPVLVMVGKVATGITSIINVINMLMPVISGIKTAFMAFNAVLAANPVILIVAAIVALIAILVVLYNKCEWFRNLVNSIFGNIVNFFKNNWQSLLLLLVNPFAGAFKLLYDNCAGFRNFVDNFIRGIADFFKNNWQALLLLLVNPFAGAFKLLYDNCAGFRNFVDNFIATIVNFFVKMYNDVKTTASNIGNALVNGIKGAVDWIVGLPQRAFTWGSDLIKGMINGIKSKINDIGNAAKSIASKITSFLHFSRPDEGPLRNYEEWMPDFIGRMAQQIREQKHLMSEAVSDMALEMSASGSSQTTNNSVVNFHGNYGFNNRNDIDYFMNQAALRLAGER